ncbi:hypothetical protein K7432_015233, partial [Basidiobolus ranarum]
MPVTSVPLESSIQKLRSHDQVQDGQNEKSRMQLNIMRLTPTGTYTLYSGSQFR